MSDIVLLHKTYPVHYNSDGMLASWSDVALW